jgi:hypothetical protein
MIIFAQDVRRSSIVLTPKLPNELNEASLPTNFWISPFFKCIKTHESCQNSMI